MYIKYIEEGSEFEINIDFRNRKKYKKLFENKLEYINKSMTMIELYDTFTPCILSMNKLLKASFVRFKESDRYKQLRHYSPPKLNLNKESRVSQSFKFVGKFVDKLKITKNQGSNDTINENDIELVYQ